MSTISGITLISKFRVKDVSALEEKEVRVGFKEVINEKDPTACKYLFGFMCKIQDLDLIIKFVMFFPGFGDAESFLGDQHGADHYLPYEEDLFQSMKHFKFQLYFLCLH